MKSYLIIVLVKLWSFSHCCISV